MINLLDNLEKNRIRKHYFVRLSIVSLLLTTLLFIIGSIFLFPSLFLISVKERESLKQSSVAERALIFHEEGDVLDMIQSTKKKILIFLIPQKELDPTRIIRTIVDTTNKSIAVEGFFLQKEGGEEGRNKMIVRGNARNRESLISFVDRLRKFELFESVELPTSNLVKSRNINFSITIFLLEL